MTGRYSTPPPTDSYPTAGKVGVIFVVVALVMLFLSAGGPAGAAQRWRAFKVWAFRKIAWGVLIIGGLLIVDSWFRS